MAGKGVQPLFQEAGGHRVQRIPPTEKRGRIHTSSVTVALVEAGLSTPMLSLSASDLHIEWFSGSGAGGQHRNKHQNCCRVIHLATGMVESRQGRSREVNKREAIAALNERLNATYMQKHVSMINSMRQNQIGTGLRGDKIRTYREKDDRVINHLNNKTARYRQVLKGEFDKLWD